MLVKIITIDTCAYLLFLAPSLNHHGVSCRILSFFLEFPTAPCNGVRASHVDDFAEMYPIPCVVFADVRPVPRFPENLHEELVAIPRLGMMLEDVFGFVLDTSRHIYEKELFLVAYLFKRLLDERP